MPRLTDLRVDQAKLPASGQVFVWCSQDRGFGVRLNASGTRTFVVQGRVEGRERRLSIGHRDLLSMRMGVDPVAEKLRQEHLTVTLRQAMADYCENKQTKNGALKARTQSDIAAALAQKLCRLARRANHVNHTRCLRQSFRRALQARTDHRQPGVPVSALDPQLRAQPSLGGR
jgi:hypothetical protein